VALSGIETNTVNWRSRLDIDHSHSEKKEEKEALRRQWFAGVRHTRLSQML
jgi:hypothetical protein